MDSTAVGRWPIAEELRKAQIVVVEDNPGDVFLIRKALEESGLSYLMTRFEDGQEALEALCPETGEPQVRPDIILLDLNLPRSEGIDVLRQIRLAPRLAGVPVAILTSSESPVDRQNASQFGADRYILKPAQLDEFFARITREVKELMFERERMLMDRL